MRSLTLLALCVACGQSPLDHVKAPNPDKPFTFALEAELIPYWARFTESVNAKSSHVAGFFKKLDKPTVGLCTSYEEGSRKIEIDPDYWQSVNALGKEQLVFHELGHCALNLDHNSNMLDLHEAGMIPASIMYPYVFGEEPYYEEFRNYYIKELKP